MSETFRDMAEFLCIVPTDGRSLAEPRRHFQLRGPIVKPFIAVDSPTRRNEPGMTRAPSATLGGQAGKDRPDRPAQASETPAAGTAYSSAGRPATRIRPLRQSASPGPSSAAARLRRVGSRRNPHLASGRPNPPEPCMDAPSALSRANRPALRASLAHMVSRRAMRRIAAPPIRLAQVPAARGDPLRSAAKGPARASAAPPQPVDRGRRSDRESMVGEPTCKAGRGAARRDSAASARRI